MFWISQSCARVICAVLPERVVDAVHGCCARAVRNTARTEHGLHRRRLERPGPLCAARLLSGVCFVFVAAAHALVL
jgi:hypothetical protein